MPCFCRKLSHPNIHTYMYIMLSRKRAACIACYSRASASGVPICPFPILPRASYLSSQLFLSTTLAHNLGGGRPPLPSKTSIRNVWIQPWFIRYCWVYRKSVNKLLIDSYTFNGILQSVERSCPIDRHELVYIDKEWAGRGGSFLISPWSNR